MRCDGERHRQYLDALSEGKATIKGGRMYPHDIVHKLLMLNPKRRDQRAEVEQLEHQWNAMVKVSQRSLEEYCIYASARVQHLDHTEMKQLEMMAQCGRLWELHDTASIEATAFHEMEFSFPCSIIQ